MLLPRTMRDKGADVANVRCAVFGRKYVLNKTDVIKTATRIVLAFAVVSILLARLMLRASSQMSLLACLLLSRNSQERSAFAESGAGYIRFGRHRSGAGACVSLSVSRALPRPS